jgi:hypothetical protein
MSIDVEVVRRWSVGLPVSSIRSQRERGRAYQNFPASTLLQSLHQFQLLKMVIRSTNSPLTPELDVLVQQQMDKWKVPGLTMAIVHGSSTWSKVDTPTN